MKQAIWATLEHLCSTDQTFKKQHDKCPPGTDSCEYRKYEAAGKLQKYRHPPRLHPASKNI